MIRFNPLAPGRWTNYALWVYLGVGTLFFVPFITLLERQMVFEFANLAIVALASGTAVAFGPAAWRIVRAPLKSVGGADALIVGIVVASVACAYMFAVHWLWRAVDKPDWLIDHWTVALSRWVFVMGAILVMVSSGAEDGQLNVRAYLRAGIITACGVAAAALLFTIGYG
jgi:hypothetical protein